MPEKVRAEVCLGCQMLHVLYHEEHSITTLNLFIKNKQINKNIISPAQKMFKHM